MIKRILLIAVLFFIPSLGYSANCGGSPDTYYVDYVIGDDTAAGTSEGTAWQHSPGDDNATDVAACSLQAGDTVIFKGGISYLGRIDIDVSGSEGLPITYDGNTTGAWGTGKAIINGNATYNFAFFTAATRNYITIDNFDITNQSDDNPSGGIVFTPTTGVIIQNCKIHEIGSWENTDFYTVIQDQGGIKVGDSTGASTLTTIQNNEIYKVGGYGVRLYGGSGCSIIGNNIGYNIFGIDVASSGAGLPAENNIIRSNIIHDSYYMLNRTTSNPDGFFAAEVTGTVADPCATCSTTVMEAAGAPGWGVNDYATGYLIYNTSDLYSRNQVLSNTADTVTSSALTGGSINEWSANNTFQMFYYPHTDGIFLRQGSGTYAVPTGNIIERNLIYDTVPYNEQIGGTGGISLSVTGANIIRNNVIINAMYVYAIYIHNSYGVGIYNNSIYNISSQGTGSIVINAPPGTDGNFIIKNNVVVGGWLLSWNADGDTGWDIDNNYWSSDRVSPFTDSSTPSYYNFAQYQALAGSPDANGQFDATESNIKFTNVATQATANLADLSPLVGSPLINNGANLSGIFTDDYNGNSRIAPWDIGAYEYLPGINNQNCSIKSLSGGGKVRPLAGGGKWIP